ncbi:MAG: hybrid sensor histidine kinase/response regulator, partial [Chloroflexi bacterium]
MRFLRSIQGKLFVAFLTVVLIPLIGTGLYGNWITSRIIEERVIESARSNVEQHAQQIAGFLESVRGDVLYLAHLDSLQRLLQARAQGDDEGVAYWRTQLARDFLIFSAARPTYYQVRYLDETGREVVRVDSDGRLSRIIPQDKLQDKSHRYYFQETIKLGPGEIYVSPLDLNREHGQIEVPYRPVIRYATPIYVGNALRGIVIINVYADYFLRFLYEQGPQKGMLLMVDQDGYYLAHPDPTRRWGGPVDLNTEYGLWRDYPDAASQVLSGQEGTFISGDQA